MQPFILFCKSFRDDVLRVKKLLESVTVFNQDLIPFYLSAPEKDLDIFHQHIDFKSLQSSYNGIIELITDEAIVLSNPKSKLASYYSTKGYIGQQIVKAEAWRYLNCSAYLALDSDCFFTKPFHLSNFIHENIIEICNTSGEDTENPPHGRWLAPPTSARCLARRATPAQKA